MSEIDENENVEHNTRRNLSRREFLTRHSRGIAAAAIGAGLAGSLLTERVPLVSAANVTGSGTVGRIPKWDATTDIMNSIMSDLGTAIAPSADNSYDLGSSSSRWRTGYFGTSEVIGGDVVLSRENTGILRIQSSASTSYNALVVRPNGVPVGTQSSIAPRGQNDEGVNLSIGDIIHEISVQAGSGSLRPLRFLMGAVDVCRIPTSGTAWQPSTDNATDLGTAAQRWRNLFLAGTVKSSGTDSAAQNDVTASRSLNTVYQNTTGKNLFANVRIFVNQGSNFGAATLDSGSSNPPSLSVSAFGLPGNPNASQHSTVSGMIPSNYYYRVTGSNVTMQVWTETTF